MGRVYKYISCLILGAVLVGLHLFNTRFMSKQLAGYSAQRDLFYNNDHGHLINKTTPGKLHPSRIKFTFPNTEVLSTTISRIHLPDPCTEDVYLMTFVHSAISHVEKRQLIRETWASSYGYKMKTIFILGIENSETKSNLIQDEAVQYKDIAQFDFIDAYRNLTLKHLMGVRWVLEFCPHAKFLLKVDDDIVVNTKLILDTLLQTPALNVGIYCNVYSWPPGRNPKKKWYVTREEYPRDTYPRFCQGCAYIVATQWLPKLYAATATERFLWMDDVYVTGILAHKAGVPRVHMITYFRRWKVVSLKSARAERGDLAMTGFALIEGSSMWEDNYAHVWRTVVERLTTNE